MLDFFYGNRFPTSMTLEIGVALALVALLVVFEYLRQTTPHFSSPWSVTLTLLVVLITLIFGILVARRLFSFVAG